MKATLRQETLKGEQSSQNNLIPFEPSIPDAPGGWLGTFQCVNRLHGFETLEQNQPASQLPSALLRPALKPRPKHLPWRPCGKRGCQGPMLSLSDSEINGPEIVININVWSS
jgi:hypothetical protein